MKRAIASLLLTSTLLAPMVAMAMPSSAQAAATTPTWATYDAASHTAHLVVISAYGQDTYNFNGGTRGGFTFRVPVGSKVLVSYSNRSMHMPHGMEIVRYTGSLPTGAAPPPAFRGAASPNYLHGTMAGTVQTFSFTAGKAGTYLMICPVRNHVRFGHWDWFIVSKTATTATGVLK